MKSVYKYLLFLLLPFTWACSQVEEGGPVTPGTPVDLQINLRSMDPDVPVRIVVANPLNGEILFNEPGLDLFTPFTVNIPSGRLNVYAFVNEPVRIQPALEALEYESDLDPITILFDDIKDIADTPDHSPGRTNFPAMARSDIRVRPRVADPTEAEVSTDDGKTWNSVLEMKLKRLAVKITLGLYKKTPVDTDIVKIDRVQIIRIPYYSYVQQDIPYSDPDFEVQEIYNNPGGIVLNNNNFPNGAPVGVFQNEMVTEYIPADKTRPGDALVLRLFAFYNGERVIYTVPVRGNLTVADYALQRNNHYVVRPIIASKGEIIYMPESGYQVLDWEDANTGIDFDKDQAIMFAANWTPGTNVTGQDVRVGGNETVEYNFTLSYPKGATWTATLTNPHDFMFDYSGNAISGGLTDPGVWYKIRVRPIRETNRNDVKTQFYITVRNGNRIVELNLPDPGNPVGTGNHRFNVIQIPN